MNVGANFDPPLRANSLRWPTLALCGLDVLALDDPIGRPVRTSFGTMRSRPALMVRLTDDTGTSGFGEVWCNFPEGGVQPDIGKWGGLSANLQLAERIDNPDVWICPHWWAGGVGLAASLHYKAAIGGGCVEVDANPNPQRTRAFVKPLEVTDGWITLPNEPGVVPSLAPAYGDAAPWTSDVAP